MSQVKCFGKLFGKLIGVAVLGFLCSPIYARHQPGSAILKLTVVQGTVTHTVTLDTINSHVTYGKLTCGPNPLYAISTRNIVCNLPGKLADGVTTFRFPATGAPAFAFTRSTPSTLGAQFWVNCNAPTAGAPCSTTQYKFTGSKITKVAGLNGTLEEVKLEIGFTIDLRSSPNGSAAAFDSKGKFYDPATLSGSVLGNKHTVSASFTYALSSGGSGCTSYSEPFNDPDCIRKTTIPCASPSTSSGTGVQCTAIDGYNPNLGGKFEAKSNTSSASIAGGEQFHLQSGSSYTCPGVFTSSTAVCYPIVVGEAALTFGFKKVGQWAELTGSGVGRFGEYPDVLAESIGHDVQCDMHESGGTFNPKDKATVKVRTFGKDNFFTESLNVLTTSIGLPGGAQAPAEDIRYGFDFNGDGYPDVWVVYDVQKIVAATGVDMCAAFAQQQITLVQQALGDVKVEGTYSIVDYQTGKPKPPTEVPIPPQTRQVLTSCDIAAIVGPCN